MLEYDPLLLPERVNEFASYLLGVKGCSKLTVNGYVRDLRLLFEYLAATKKEHISPADIKKDYDLSFIDDSFLAKITIGDIYAFLAYCTSERDNNLTTKNRKASSIRGFFKYISDNMKYITVNPVSHLQIPSDKKKLPRYLTLEQSEALLNAVICACFLNTWLQQKKSIFPLQTLKKITTFHLLTTAFLQKSLSEIYMRFLPTAPRNGTTI